jgi:hypothetical protein
VGVRASVGYVAAGFVRAVPHETNADEQLA